MFTRQFKILDTDGKELTAQEINEVRQWFRSEKSAPVVCTSETESGCVWRFQETDDRETIQDAKNVAQHHKSRADSLEGALEMVKSFVRAKDNKGLKQFLGLSK